MASETLFMAVSIATLAAVVYNIRITVIMQKQIERLLQNKGLK